jgi:aromatic ring-cleaving dioxygenase
MAAAQAAEDPARITGYHAHVYYDASTKSLAAQLRAGVEQRFDVSMGRWHDAPIGPHPCGSYQIAFAPALFGELVPWLALNRQGLTVFVQPRDGQRDRRSQRPRHLARGEPQAEPRRAPLSHPRLDPFPRRTAPDRA